jgi:release factor glutamine methyltransferase
MTTEPEDATSVYAAVHRARATLAAAGVASPAADAEQLAAHVLGVDGAELQRRMILREAADAEFLERFDDLVDRRAERIPVQHLTGRAGFRTLELAVGPGVFVPRPETELLAELAIEAARHVLASGRPPVVVDLCTGSGAIALALKAEVPDAEVHAVELNHLAHGWAQLNRDQLGLEIDLRLGDGATAFEDLTGQVDIVACNPPYIPTGMVPVDPEVRVHDPREALYGGSTDGLAIPLAMARRAADLLHPGGLLVMEHADVQGETLPARLHSTGQWADIEDHHDLNDRPRATVARRIDIA